MSDLALLPGDPVGYFSLQSGYDRRDLKRAYGKAIRKYKPETHPAEFGLIRQAYERLEKSLRYGQQQNQKAAAIDAWTTTEPATTEPTASDPTPSNPTASEPLAEGRRRDDSRPSDDSRSGDDSRCGDDARPNGDVAGVPRAQPSARPDAARPQRPTELPLRQLALIDPAAAMKKFQTMTRRTPPDYYLAAVLADALSGKPTAHYVGYLIDGLVAYPSDPGLIMLATEFLQSEVPDALAAKMVVFVAKKLRAPSYYMLTESLWMRLSQLLPFDEFVTLLQQCEREIRQTDDNARSTFYLRLLRSAIWVAPTDWTDRVLNEIESQSATMDHSSQNDVEYLSDIRRLLNQNRDTRFQHPVREKLMEAIRDLCQRDDPASVAKVVQTLTEIARDSGGVQKAFPIHRSSDDMAWAALVHSLIYQLQTYLDEPAEVPSERIIKQALHLVADLEPTAVAISSTFDRAVFRYKTLPMIVWMIGGSLFGSFFVVVPTVMLPGVLSAIGPILGIVALIVGLLVSFLRVLYPRFLQPKMETKQLLWSRKEYEKNWRSRLFRYAQSSASPIQVLMSRTDAVCERTNQTPMASLIRHFSQTDSGLCIFAVLQTVLR